MKKKDLFKDVTHEFAKKYETMAILNPDLEEAGLNKFIDNVKEVISENDAEFLDFSDWGSRKLPYLIKNFNRGRFVVIHFSSKGSFIKEFDRKLKLMEDCIRFQTIVFTKNMEPQKEEAVNE